jgi:hypothetical protein
LAGYLRELASFAGWGFIVLGATCVVFLLLTSLISLYHGERTRGRSVIAHGTGKVEQCARVGPVSYYGFGYWWECRTTITFADGRRVETALGASIVSPADKNGVPLVERCSRNNRDDCTYTRPGSGFAYILAGLLAGLRNAIAVVGVLFSAALLSRGLLGQRLYGRLYRLVDRRAAHGSERGGGEKSEVTSGEPAWVMSGEPAWGQGVEISFSYPPGPFETIYQSIASRLSIDGRAQDVPSWGTHYYPVPAGSHTIRVVVPFESKEFAPAECSIAARPGERCLVEYQAPRAIAFRGKIRQVAGKERS